MEIVEKDGGLPGFGTHSEHIFFSLYLPTVEIKAQLTGKIGAHSPVVEGLMLEQ